MATVGAKKTAAQIIAANFDITEDITPSTPPLGRMENLLMPSNFYDTVYKQSIQNAKTIKRHKQDFQVRRLGYHGKVSTDPYYDGVLDFSTDDGHTFSAPAMNVEGAKPVQIRLTLSQFQVEPLILGWGLDWYLPTGWRFLDRLGRRTYEEAVSNPMVVTRVMQSPTNPQPAGFRVFVAKRYY